MKNRKQRQRKKVPKTASTNKVQVQSEENKTDLPLNVDAITTENVFKNININTDSLNQYETTSEKSFKSSKTNKSEGRITKKDKLSIRRKYLLSRLDMLKEEKQTAKETAKIRNKRSKVPLIGNTNDLHDSLASIEAFLNSAEKEKKVKRIRPKKARLLKAKQRKKSFISNLNAYKDVMKQKKFQEDPLKIMTQHVQNIVEQQINKNK